MRVGVPSPAKIGPACSGPIGYRTTGSSPCSANDFGAAATDRMTRSGEQADDLRVVVDICAGFAEDRARRRIVDLDANFVQKGQRGVVNARDFVRTEDLEAGCLHR